MHGRSHVITTAEASPRDCGWSICTRRPRTSAQWRPFASSVSVRRSESPLAIFKAGRHADNLSMDILREEWYAIHPHLEDRMIDPFR